MLTSILSELPWTHGNTGRNDLLLLLDDCIAEMWRWNDVSLRLPSDIAVQSLYDIAAHAVEPIKPRHIVAFTSQVDAKVVYALRSAATLNHVSECYVFTTVHQSAVNIEQLRKKNKGVNEQNGYSAIQDALLPLRAVVTLLPSHTTKIIHSAAKEMVDLGVLASPSSRIARPISLSSLSNSAPLNRDYSSMAEVNVSDLPTSVKTCLRNTAHDLAGALVCDYGLDVSSSVYALGKTSSIIGHNILPIISELTELRDSLPSTLGGRVRSALLGEGEGEVAPLQPASLVLVDRCEDLWTPCGASAGSTSAAVAEGTGASLAHRILNTLNYCQYNTSKGGASPDARSRGSEGERERESTLSTQLDVTLQAPLLEVQDWDAASALLGVGKDGPEPAQGDIGQWNRPLSALTNLPLQLTPSLRLDGHAQSPILVAAQQSVLLGTEEEGKAALCEALKVAILSEGGALPPAKKRGLGAEVLAYVQALVQCPLPAAVQSSVASDGPRDSLAAAAEAYRQDQRSGLGYNYAACARHQGLLSLSLAVVEAMQRSSGKQLQPLCDWQCAYDVRAAREAELDGLARKFRDLDVCIAHLMSYFLPGNKTVLAPGIRVASGAKEKEAPPTVGPLDLTHILMQLIRVVSIFRQAATSSESSNFDALMECIGDYILNRSEGAELVYLEGLRFLPPGTVREVLSYRAETVALDTLLCSETDPSSPEQVDLQAQVEARELSIKQLQSSVRDCVGTALRRVQQLSVEYAAGRQTLLASTSGSSKKSDIAPVADQMLDLLQPLPGQSGPTVNGGLVARITHAYLQRRAAIVRSRSLFAARDGEGEDEAGERDGLAEALEYIESPLEQMKRAGLGLLSKGLGSLFGGSAPAAPSAPHPAERPVLVVFVLGGISLKEAAQVQQLLRSSKAAAVDARIILLSTRLLGAENVVHLAFS